MRCAWSRDSDAGRVTPGVADRRRVTVTGRQLATIEASRFRSEEGKDCAQGSVAGRSRGNLLLKVVAGDGPGNQTTDRNRQRSKNKIFEVHEKSKLAKTRPQKRPSRKDLSQHVIPGEPDFWIHRPNMAELRPQRQVGQFPTLQVDL